MIQMGPTWGDWSRSGGASFGHEAEMKCLGVEGIYVADSAMNCRICFSNKKVITLPSHHTEVLILTAMST